MITRRMRKEIKYKRNLFFQLMKLLFINLLAQVVVCFSTFLLDLDLIWSRSSWRTIIIMSHPLTSYIITRVTTRTPPTPPLLRAPQSSTVRLHSSHLIMVWAKKVCSCQQEIMKYFKTLLTITKDHKLFPLSSRGWQFIKIPVYCIMESLECKD